jgi:hypothetical protein
LGADDFEIEARGNHRALLARRIGHDCTGLIGDERGAEERNGAGLVRLSARAVACDERWRGSS